MKKYIFEIVLIICFLQIFSIISFADTIPTLYLKDVTKYQNEDKVTVELYMENVDSKIVTLGLDVIYDSSKVEYVSSKAGKDLGASFKLAENVKEENRVAIGAVSFDGFENNGLYYSITFKVKDDSENIPLKLQIRDVSDEQGNDVTVNSKDGKIRISSEESTKKEEKVTTESQKINEFEKTDVSELESIENLINRDGNIKISESDDLIYETENNNIIEVLDDGTMIPNQDGTTNVRVKLNGQNIVNVKIVVKDGKILKISGNDDDLDFVPEATTQEDFESNNENQKNLENNNNSEENNLDSINTNNKENNLSLINTKDKENSKQLLVENKSENQNSKLKVVAIVIVVITILFIIFYTIKKKRGGKR